MDLFITSITRYELLIGARTPEKVKDVELLTEDLGILDFDKRASEQAAIIYHQLRKINKLIEFRDIFIAAICMVNQLPLYTLNTKHFERVEGLELYVP